MRVIFAGGGTGGHIYPAIAMAREILRRESKSKVLFVGTREGVESRILPQEGLELQTLQVMGWKGKKKTERLKALLVLPRALKDSFSILRTFQPDAVIGVGGFVSGPLVLAASLARRKTMLQEQNSVPGMTNRILGRLVRRVYTAYHESHSYFPKEKVLQTGNPIRKGLGEGGREDALRHFGLSTEKKTVLVLGGSRGAHAVNELVSEMVQKVNWKNLPVQFLHQTGEADLQKVSEVYGSSGTQAVVRPYIHEIDRAYAAADFAVSRAGAVALSELCAAGIPMFLIPFP
jgi:UDP-N-acetylglucosamine--N-acetylmuramyl-(pentapeptide) pyrophosphoryl-undecaprenol N-acetylglucosamine transferase